MRFRWAAAAAAAAAAAVIATGCGGGGGLTAAEVDEAIAEAIAGLPEPQPGLSAGEAEEMIQAAIENLPSAEEGLTMAQVLEAVHDAIDSAHTEWAQPDGSLQEPPPPRFDPAAYTQLVVDEAIARYEAEGFEAAVAHYSSPVSVDGQWYVFVVAADGTVIAHPDAGLVGQSLHGWVGTDINGYEFGPEMLAADEAGRWVPYVYLNPAAGALGDEDSFELKNAWVVRHDGLLFGSGWYVNSEEFLPALISEAAGHFRSGGLEAILAFYNDPEGVSVGLIPTVTYYNSTNTLDGYFSGFIAAPDGEILSHFDPALIGTDIEDLLGSAVRGASAEGAWVTAQDNPAGSGPQAMRIWVINVEGTLIGAGWYRN